MNKMDLVQCFHDTVARSESGELAQRTTAAIQRQTVYKEQFTAPHKQYLYHADIFTEANTTFAAASKYRGFGKTAVLNFANSLSPGGGVQYGAMSQEECLCRSSNLYLCLTSPALFDDYYNYHRRIDSCFASDRLIYTCDVTVFKTDDPVPQPLPPELYFETDVITCAAPCLTYEAPCDPAVLKALFRQRAKNIFEAAAAHHVQSLILGAFGCGAFCNPPEIVAAAFRDAIAENSYNRVFRKIVFAIKTDGGYSPNYDAFSRVFPPMPND